MNTTLSISGKITSPEHNGDFTDLPIIIKLTNPDSIEELIHTKTLQGYYDIDHLFNISGIWSIQANLSENSDYTPVSSEIKQIKVVHNSGYAILINANKSDSNSIPAFNRTTQHVHQSLKYRGFLNEDILYFNQNLGLSGVDYLPNKQMIQEVLSGTNDVSMNNSDLNIQSSGTGVLETLADIKVFVYEGFALKVHDNHVLRVIYFTL